ncbi:site-specific DNA-methyltransferase (plasmid) [Citrobacter freundii]|nr:site-specific DNA-methyltransferase [Citrobacter freundii]
MAGSHASSVSARIPSLTSCNDTELTLRVSFRPQPEPTPTWLTFIKNRLEISKELLSIDGSIFISCDDSESHYLKVLCDSVFQEINFVCNVIWEKKFAPQNDAKWFSDNHDHILVYAKEKNLWRPNLLPRSAEMDARYKNIDNDPRGPWQSDNMTVKTYSKDYDYPIKTPSGKYVSPTKGRCWYTSKANMEKLIADNRVWFGESGGNVPRIKRFLSEVKDGMTPTTIWKHTEVILPANSGHATK